MNNFDPSIQNSSFCAWSIYTGPSFLSPVMKDLRWNVGIWQASNKSFSQKDIKDDINLRIDAILLAFETYCKGSNKKNKHLLIPEFFFRCTAGPYPKIKIGNLDVFDYIKQVLAFKLQEMIVNKLEKIQPGVTYTVIAGSILTCNISNFNNFWNSNEVIARLDEIRNGMKSPFFEKTYEQRPQNKEMENSTSSQQNQVEKNENETSTKIQSKAEKNENETEAQTLIHFKSQPCVWNRSFNRIDGPVIYAKGDLTRLMQKYRNDPLCTVRNRSLYFYYNSQKSVEVRVIEKEYQSVIDLTMGIFDKGQLQHGNMITQWMAGYPAQNTESSDKQPKAPTYATNARFEFNQPSFRDSNGRPFDIGVEICLDHSNMRLRRKVGMTTLNKASQNNYSICKQFIPSAGMVMKSFAIATGPNSVIFNADGLQNNGNGIGLTKKDDGVYLRYEGSTWTNSLDKIAHHSSSSIAFTTKGSVIGGFDESLYQNNTRCKTYDVINKTNSNILTQSFEVSKQPMGVLQTTLFCSGLGELHLYQIK